MREFCHTNGVTQTHSHVKPPIPPEVPEAKPTAANVAPQSPAPASAVDADPSAPAAVPEIGGRRDGTDPTRFGDWEKGGRCIDF